MNPLKLIILILFLFITLKAQVIYEPISSDVYIYLDRLSHKGIIEYNELIKPLPRTYIYEKLVEAKIKANKLTSLEKDELNFHLKDYLFEKSLSSTNFSSDQLEQSGKNKFYNFDLKERVRVLTYSDSLFKINFNPILKYKTGSFDDESYFKVTYGAGFYGYIGSNIGFQFRFYNDREEPFIRGKLWNKFTPQQGRDFSLSDAERVEYSEVNAALNFNWEWGRITLGQDKINWGYAQNGQIVLSAKAPAFPFVRLDIYPTDWLHFNYMHAWLNSDVKDSNSFYKTNRIRNNNYIDRFNWRTKYLAQHTITLTPFKGLDISIGESVVYADQLEISYLIPIMFFDQADEHISRDDNYAGNNTQFFFAISSKNHVPNTHLWGSFFADELTPDGIFDPKTQYYKFGFTLGTTVVDLPINNLIGRLEFTKIYPGTYQHFIPTLTYTSSENFIGHWIGDNGDLFYASLEYRILRGLKIAAWGQFIRKGESSTEDKGYGLPMEPFLYGLRENYDYFGIKINYEILHELFLNIEYFSIDESIQNADLSFSDRKISSYSFEFAYGL